MPTENQYQTVKQQCKSFENMGYPTSFKMQSLQQGAAPAIKIDAFFKKWHFCEPDWDIVIKQLACLYKHLTRNLNKNDKNTTM